MKALLVLCAIACASATVLQEPGPIFQWRAVGDAPKDQKIQVQFSLKKDTSALARRLQLISTPGSPVFREWLSLEEERALTKVADAAPLMNYLSAHNIAAVEEHGVVHATMTVEQAERFFETRVTQFKSTKYDQDWHRAGTLHAPEEVAAVTQAVYGLHDFPLPPANRTRAPKSDADDAFPIGPTEIRRRYGVPNGLRGSGSTKVRQAVAEFQGQFMNTQDLDTFFKQEVPNAQPGDEKIYAYRGNKDTGYGVEALLDIEFIMGNAPGIPTEFWALRNFDFCSDLKTWTQSILKDGQPPLVMSVSYGLQSDVTTFCTNYQDIDQDLQRIAARGVSVIFASGDSGSGWDGENIWPSWPAISPYVTSVAATCFTNRSMTEEQATLQFGSGSGFSALAAVPDYQKQAVAQYVSMQGSQLPPANLWKTFNGNYGRATADVSALGEGYKVVVQGQTQPVGGTSASTPTYASLISLINDALVAKGKKPLGFLNPWIYKTAHAYNDVTIGTDKINRYGLPVPYGFNTAAGWDPVTGLGTPMFEEMLKDAMNQ